jgi:glycolate oxidase
MPDGTVERFGGRAPDPVGYDVVGAIVGSEGTLGVVTEATVRLLRTPHAVQTILAAFRTIEDAGEAVSAIIAAGVLPAAIEMMDALAIEAAEAAVHPGYPGGAGAVLIVELDGPHCEVAAQLDDVERMCGEAGAFEIRTAADDTERALIWKGRKSAFAAVGRISPDYIVQDGVIPRTALAQVLQAIDEVADEAGLRVANVFHAGDGNLHPLVLFDEAQGETERAEEVSNRIIELCLEHGGSITGEHGVGHDKVVHMGKMFSPVDLDVMQLVRCAFDPAGIANPGKVFPTPRLCGERPGRRTGAHPLAEAGIADVF